jgi:hypothetical protein
LTQPFLYADVSITKIDDIYLYKVASPIYRWRSSLDLAAGREETLYGIGEGLKVCMIRKKKLQWQRYIWQKEKDP